MAFTGVSRSTWMLMDSHPSQQYAGPQHAVIWLQQELTRPKATFEPTLPAEKSSVGVGGEIRCQDF